MILLDTNVVIAFFNGNQIILERIRSGINQIALSTLVVAELDYGAKTSQRSQENLQKLYRFVDIILMHRIMSLQPNVPQKELL